ETSAPMAAYGHDQCGASGNSAADPGLEISLQARSTNSGGGGVGAREYATKRQYSLSAKPPERHDRLSLEPDTGLLRQTSNVCLDQKHARTLSQSSTGTRQLCRRNSASTGAVRPTWNREPRSG